MAYETILQESGKYEATPLFLREDSNPITADPILAAKVPEWLAISRQVATGNRRRVLENGIDVMDSSDEDDPKMKPDKLTGMYTAEMDPKAGPKVLTPTEVAFQKAAGRAMTGQSQPAQDRVPTPLASPVNSDDEGMSEDQRRALNRGKRLAQKATPKGIPMPPYAKRIPDPVVPAPAKGATLEIKKAAAPPRAPADQPIGAKASPPTKGHPKGQESPEAKASHPMAKRTRSASRAGGLRSEGGSGQTDTCVAQGNPSKT
jgi:hypothetical protein